VTLGSTSTLTSACGLAFSGLSPAVLPFCDNCTVSDDQSVFQTLVVALVLTRLDYGNATLSGFPAYPLNHLQSALSASARSIAGLHRLAHVTDDLAGFHWLRAAERIKFKLAAIVY